MASYLDSPASGYPGAYKHINIHHSVTFVKYFFIDLSQKYQSIIPVSLTKLRQIVCKLLKLSTNVLTAPRICIVCILYYCVLCVLYYICNEAHQNLRARLGSRETGLNPQYLILTVPRRYFCCGSLLLSVFIIWFAYCVSDIF